MKKTRFNRKLCGVPAVTYEKGALSLSLSKTHQTASGIFKEMKKKIPAYVLILVSMYNYQFICKESAQTQQHSIFCCWRWWPIFPFQSWNFVFFSFLCFFML